MIPYPVCPDGVQSLRQKALAPELVAAWEKEANFGNPLTEEQQGKFPQFRSLLLAEGILHEMYDNKPSMFRFLQARQWDLEKAATMYRNHMEWRKREELDTWLPTPSGPMPKLLIEFYFPEIAEVKRYYPFCYHKMTKEGRPIYFDRLGAIEYKNMIKNSSPEGCEVFHVVCGGEPAVPQPCRLCSGKHIGKSHFIIDMKGFGISKLNSETRKFISDFSKIASDNYPECMHKTWIINAPFIFQTAWAMVKICSTRRRSQSSRSGRRARLHAQAAPADGQEGHTDLLRRRGRHVRPVQGDWAVGGADAVEPRAASLREILY